MRVALTRVDSRLVHGQVIEDWLPYTGADVVVVANDEVAGDPLQTAIIESCVCLSDVQVRVVPVKGVRPLLDSMAGGDGAVIILLREVADAGRLWDAGLRFDTLNLGNVHEHPGSRQVSRSVSLNEQDIMTLKGLAVGGVNVDIRAVSRDRSLSLEDVV